MPKTTQITVNGHTYNTIRDAWRALSPAGLPEITVRRRLTAGWVPEHAFTLRQVSPRERRNFCGVRRLMEELGA